MDQPKVPIFRGMKPSLSRKDRILAVLVLISALVTIYPIYKLGALYNLGFLLQVTSPIWFTGIMIVFGVLYERVLKL